MAQNGTSSFADVAQDVVGSMRRERRRTVSEGEVIRPHGNLPDGEEHDSNDDSYSDNPFASGAQDSDEQLGNPGRKRWRWLRNVFAGKR